MAVKPADPPCSSPRCATRPARIAAQARSFGHSQQFWPPLPALAVSPPALLAPVAHAASQTESEESEEKTAASKIEGEVKELRTQVRPFALRRQAGSPALSQHRNDAVKTRRCVSWRGVGAS